MKHGVPHRAVAQEHHRVKRIRPPVASRKMAVVIHHSVAVASGPSSRGKLTGLSLVLRATGAACGAGAFGKRRCRRLRNRTGAEQEPIEHGKQGGRQRPARALQTA